MKITKTEIARRRIMGECRAEVWHLIRYEMKKLGYHNSSLAKKLGCSHRIVSATLLGKKHSPTVLNGLRELGVPEKLLFDPHQPEMEDAV